jgi:molecular chaperone DnaK (HSP70)
MASKTGILCVDFGTSSTRAAILEDGRQRPRPLELGEAVRSSIDRASIPSAVFVSADCSEILFGEQALSKGLRGEKSCLFETSPKRWMTADSPTILDDELFEGTGLTRKHLLAGLLAQSFSAAATAAKLPKSKILELETRIAHPVWRRDTQVALKKHLEWITDIGRLLSGVTDQAISTRQLLSAIKKSSNDSKRARIVDVEEPVAAALELFENSDNSREICVVIDVGAGTTDLGIFLSLTPDERSSRHKRKFIQAASPRSIYMAGDLIDEEVIEMIRSRANRVRSGTLQDLQRRKRSIKETLFSRARKVFEAGVEITLSDLEKQERILQMRDALAVSFRDLVEDASAFIATFVQASFHRADQINVVFAGGGSNIGFLHQAVGQSFKLSNGRSVPVVIRAATTVARPLPAAVERLAVAMGGTTPDKYWPVTSLAGAGREAPSKPIEGRYPDWWRGLE